MTTRRLLDIFPLRLFLACKIAQRSSKLFPADTNRFGDCWKGAAIHKLPMKAERLQAINPHYECARLQLSLQLTFIVPFLLALPWL